MIEMKPRDFEPLPMTEEELSRTVIDLAHVLGYRVAHFRPAMTKHGWRTPVQADGRGWPDHILVKPGRFIVAELKSANGKLSDEQKEWLDLLKQAGVECYVWRPNDLEEIIEHLQAERAGTFVMPGMEEL